MPQSASHIELIAAIASKDYTAGELSRMFDMPVSELKRFVERNRKELEAARAAIELAREEIDESADDDRVAPVLWIRDQTKRLRIYQTMVEMLYVGARITFDSTVLRELRSYMYYAAQELGQLQHRGSAGGDGTTASYELIGVDMEQLR
jgi:hypothetical protein